MPKRPHAKIFTAKFFTAKSFAPQSLARFLPVLGWGATYSKSEFRDDFIAAVIVTIMLIPQSLAYAMLAGLPAQAGLYASIVPILLYAVFGTSRALAVGPVAVVSLMTAAAIEQVATSGTAGYAAAALTLAFLSGAILLAMGALRLGFLANFLSHPVISGFITAAGLLIAAGQIGHILGVSGRGHTMFDTLGELLSNLAAINFPTLVIGIASIGFLVWVRRGAREFLIGLGLPQNTADIATKTAPVIAVAASTLAVWGFGLADRGVAIVGAVPQALPPFTLPPLPWDLVEQLFLPALVISIIGFVESISVAQTLAAKKRQRVDPDQELIGLGAANLGAAFSGGYPVTGGFARSVVNFDAGAATPAAGAFTALGLAFAALFLTPALYFLPKATLAATIIVAVLSLVDFSILRKTWAYSRADFVAVVATIFLTLGHSVELGVMAGVGLSIAIHLLKSSRPHMAIVGQVPGTQHYRNLDRHAVITDSRVVTLRVDESLYFANARYLEDQITDLVVDNKTVTDFVLMCPAVNAIDTSALESLEAINHKLLDAGVRFHLSEVKGPVMDALKRSEFLDDLSGEVFLSQHQAMDRLCDGAPDQPC